VLCVRDGILVLAPTTPLTYDPKFSSCIYIGRSRYSRKISSYILKSARMDYQLGEKKIKDYLI
jgi:hypothetical protein